jgi:alpha-amylase
MSLFDAPLHMNFYTASRSGGSYDMRNLLNNTLMKDNPLKAVTIVENHDTQPLQALESPVDWWFKPIAYAYILTREEGYPTVFHPDLYGATYTDKGYTINMAPVSKLQKLIEARKKYAYGKQNLYNDHWDIVGWTREGSASMPGSGLATIVSDGPAGSKWMFVGKNFSGKAFFDYTGNRTDTVTINADGWGEFKVNGGSVSVWVPPTSTTPPASSTTNVTFKVQNATTVWGQDVYIVGNIAQLGSWNTAQAKKLTPSAYPTWDGVVALPMNTAIQFKFIKKNAAGTVVWEGGSNRSWTTPGTTTGAYTGTWQP